MTAIINNYLGNKQFIKVLKFSLKVIGKKMRLKFPRFKVKVNKRLKLVKLFNFKNIYIKYIYIYNYIYLDI